ncbi:MAG: HU family DNA-binding protein, partial [Muribaculaceae bacterium]|nr:HU family DNA-binding protein [Muribaculaceae bacterium]
MNNKITFPRLATLLADRSGRSKRFSEDFLREFFSLISETLEDQESVKIKGLGTFRLTRVEPRRSVDVTTGEPMEIAGHTKVVFTPAKELADAVNSPFEAFTAIEISDDADIDQLFPEDEIEISGQTDPESEESEETALAVEIPEETKVTYESNQPIETTVIEEDNQVIEEDNQEEDGDEADVEGNEDSEGSEDSEVTEKSEKNEESEENEEIEGSEEVEEEEQPKKRTWKKILLVGLVASIVALFATLTIWYFFATDDFNKRIYVPLTSAFTRPASKASSDNVYATAADTPSASSMSIDSAKDSIQEEQEDNLDVPTAPSDAVVYDTIGTTRYLTTMAKSHYGNFNLWPYIYQENQSILGHPDRIRPGTAVVIPKLSKYGVDHTNRHIIKKKKKLGVEIYARYGK